MVLDPLLLWPNDLFLMCGLALHCSWVVTGVVHTLQVRSFLWALFLSPSTKETRYAACRLELPLIGFAIGNDGIDLVDL